LRRLRSERERQQSESAVAEETLQQLLGESTAEWATYLVEREELWSEALVRRLIDEAVKRLDQRAVESIEILAGAEIAATGISDAAAQAEYRAEIWKNYANTHRMLGSYEEALEAADSARALAESSPTGGFLL